MPRAQAAIDAEWQKLRDCDEGRGTWDESEVRGYWDVKHEAKLKLDKTGVHTHFRMLFDFGVEKASELEESKRRYKGRVVFGGHRIHDEFGLAAGLPEQGWGASMISASELFDATAMLPGCSVQEAKNDQAQIAAAVQAVKAGSFDAIVFVIGGDWNVEHEAMDRTDIDLPGNQASMVAAVAAAAGPSVPLVSVMVHGGSMDISSVRMSSIHFVSLNSTILLGSSWRSSAR